MSVKELIKKLVDCPMEATVEVEVLSDHYSSYSCSDDIKVVQVSDAQVLITEVD